MRPIVSELWISPRPATETDEDWVFTVVGESDSRRSEEQDVPWQVHVYDPESGDERRFDGCAGLVDFAEGILRAAKPKVEDGQPSVDYQETLRILGKYLDVVAVLQAFPTSGRGNSPGNASSITDWLQNSALPLLDKLEARQ